MPLLGGKKWHHALTFVEDKTQDLMSKFYSEFSNFKTEVNSKLDSLQTGQQKLENVITRLEHKVDSNSKSLFDGCNQTYEKLLEVEKKVDGLSDVDRNPIVISLPV